MGKAIFRKGNQNRLLGLHFEQAIQMQSNLQQVHFVRIKQQAEWRKTPQGLKLFPAKSGFDYVLIKKGSSVFIDAKSFDQKRITCSMITPHQVHEMAAIQRAGALAGYLCWLRDINRVVFHEASRLVMIRSGDGIEPEEGLCLGSGEAFDLNKLFKI